MTCLITVILTIKFNCLQCELTNNGVHESDEQESWKLSYLGKVKHTSGIYRNKTVTEQLLRSKCFHFLLRHPGRWLPRRGNCHIPAAENTAYYTACLGKSRVIYREPSEVALLSDSSSLHVLQLYGVRGASTYTVHDIVGRAHCCIQQRHVGHDEGSQIPVQARRHGDQERAR